MLKHTPPRVSHDGSIVIPDVHGEILGLNPNMHAQVHHVTDDHWQAVIVAAFDAPLHDMMLLNCTLTDGKGHLRRLCDAVARVGVNIVRVESAPLGGEGKGNHVTMLLDWNDIGGDYPADAETPPGTRQIYHDYQNVVLLEDLRSVVLFESILAHCGKCLARDADVSGRAVPQMNLYPLYGQKQLPSHAVLVEADNDGLRLDISKHLDQHNIECAARPEVQGPPTWGIPPFHYIVVTDTKKRLSRVFVLSPQEANNLVHVGFYLHHKPGQLSDLLQVLEQARCGVVTSELHNYGDPEYMLWEAILLCDGAGQARPSGGAPQKEATQVNEAAFRWVAETLQRAAEEVGFRNGFDVGVGVPRALIQDVLRPFSKEVKIAPGVQSNPTEKLDDVLHILCESLYKDLAEEEAPKVEKKWVRTVLSRLSRAPREPKRGFRHASAAPTPGLAIFLSYAGVAGDHALRLTDALQEHGHHVEVYQQPDGNIIMDEILLKIISCDFFIGLWHHEEVHDDNRESIVSPWLLIEYGIARAMEKEFVILHSEQLRDLLWQRVNPGMANIQYTDLGFVADAIPKVLEKCGRYMDDAWAMFD